MNGDGMAWSILAHLSNFLGSRLACSVVEEADISLIQTVDIHMKETGWPSSSLSLEITSIVLYRASSPARQRHHLTGVLSTVRTKHRKQQEMCLRAETLFHENAHVYLYTSPPGVV